MDIRDKIKEEYIFAVLAVILGASALFLFFKADLPNLKLYRISFKEVRQKEKELKVRKATIQQISKLKEEISKIDEEYESFIQKIILEPGTFEAVKVITDIAKGLKIEFLSLQPMPPQRLELYQGKDKKSLKFFQKEGKDFFLWEIPVLIKIKSNYASFLDFVKRIEADQRFLKIKALQIKKDPSTPLVHNVEITISMFSLPEAVNPVRKAGLSGGVKDKIE